MNALQMIGLYPWDFALFVDIHNGVERILKAEKAMAKRQPAIAAGQGLAAALGGLTPTTPPEITRDRIKEVLSGNAMQRVRLLADLLAMKSVTRHFETIELDLTLDHDIKYDGFLVWYEELRTRVFQELEDRWFLFIDPAKVELYREPFKTWESVPDKFPTAKDEIATSSRCLALGEGTASVFHAMRVVETGLVSLGADLGISSVTAATKPWGSILNEIDQAIPAKVKAETDPLKKKQIAEFYHWASTQIEHFREAWRDRVAHRLRTYTVPEAEGVFVAVRAFMCKLVAQGLEEIT